MKTLLVPTDFSAASRKAANYAAELAKNSGARIILMHAYYSPVVPMDIAIPLPLQQMEEDAMVALHKLEKSIRRVHGVDLVIECRTRYGAPAIEIVALGEEEKVDFIVVGMQGGGYLTERFIGTTTTSVIANADRPVLVIGKQARYKGIRRIVLATDGHKVHHPAALRTLRELAELFKARIYILHVAAGPLDLIALGNGKAEQQITHALGEAKFTFHQVVNKNTLAGIRQFVKEYNIDMVTVMPRKHSIIGEIIRQPLTRKMAFHTSVPLLAIQE